jgi:hypothetical protein
LAGSIHLGKELVRLLFVLDRQLPISLVARSRRAVSVDIVPGCRKGLPEFARKPDVADLLKDTSSSHSVAPVGIEEKIVFEERRGWGEGLEEGKIFVADQYSDSCLV